MLGWRQFPGLIAGSLTFAGCQGASGGDLFGAIVFDRGDFYVRDSLSIVRCSSAGECTELAYAPSNEGHLTVDADFVYFTTARYDRDLGQGLYAVSRLDKRGGTPEVLSQTSYRLAIVGGDIALGGEWLYWVDGYAPPQVMCASATAASPTPEVVAGSDSPAAYAPLAVDETKAFWSSGSTLLARPLEAGPISILTDGLSTPADMLSYGDALFVVDTTLHGGSVLRVEKATGVVTVLAAGQSVPLSIATDGVFVYWANSTINDSDPRPEGGAILRVPLTGGGAPELLRTHLNAPEHLAVGGDVLVWTDWDGYHQMGLP